MLTPEHQGGLQAKLGYLVTQIWKPVFSAVHQLQNKQLRHEQQNKSIQSISCSSSKHEPVLLSWKLEADLHPSQALVDHVHTMRNDADIWRVHVGKQSTLHHSISFHGLVPLQMIRCQIQYHTYLQHQSPKLYVCHPANTSSTKLLFTGSNKCWGETCQFWSQPSELQQLWWEIICGRLAPLATFSVRLKRPQQVTLL